MLSAAQIIAENLLPGTPSSVWDTNGKLSANIQGYAAQFSVDHGQTIQFKVDTNSTNYELDIYRIGWYGGDGARRVATVFPTNFQDQPNPTVILATNTVDASNWHVSASWAVPANAVSGVYMAKLVRNDGTYGQNQILFVVRDDEGHSDALFQTSDTTWQAYNDWGGSSLYTPNYPNGRSLAVSYARPFANRDDNPLNYFWGEEYAMIRFMERNGYDVSYASGIDTARYGSELLEHKVFMSVGHDEYWSGDQRANVEAARDAGVNLAFFSGNEMFWKTRWASDLAGDPYTMMVCYKETLAGAKIDPSDEWTGTWRDPRFSPPANGGRPENAVTGTIFTVNSNGDLGSTIDVSSDFAALRFWRNTDVATLDPGNSVSLGDRALGYEWDEDLDNGFRPAGLIDLSSTTRTVPQYLQDYGATYGKGTATHSLTEYRAASGALVFSAGSIQYSWALDDQHAVYQAATDRNIQQATINLFADMGVQPGTLMAGLIAATLSTDHLAPISTIVSPTLGAVLPPDSPVTVRGTAVDRGGGVVAAVEVSVDGGLTWHRATGTTSWTYTFTTRGSGEFTILSRAVDDSGNLEQNGPRVQVNPVLNPGIYSLWSNGGTPATIDSKDAQAIEVGVRFTTDTNGFVTAIRFYKATTNTGAHVGNLWTNTGQLLATGIFSNETASGWQTLTFDAPVPVSAGVTYIASYFAPNGHYSDNPNYFTTQGVNNGPLHAVPTGAAGGNGVYKYGTSSLFPNLTFQNTNYWVDVVLNTSMGADNTAPTVDSFSTADGSDTLTTDSSIVIKFSEAINAATINPSTVQLLNPDPNSIPGGCCSTPGGWCSGCPLLMGANTKVVNATLTYDSIHHWVILTPQTPLSTSSVYTVMVTGGSSGVKDLAGNPVFADTGASFLTPAQAASEQSTIWPASATPTTVDDGEAKAIEVGTKFTADASGQITGIRFYKSALNTGTHVANLWTSTGQLLATATFTNETGTGWQQVNFATPVSITAGVTYIASYHTNAGRYAADNNGLATPVNSDLLHVPANGGVYLYGAGGFPTLTYKSTNYWVDVVLRTPAPLGGSGSADITPPTVTGFSPATNSTNIAISSAATVTFSEAIDPSTIVPGTLRLLDNGNNMVPANVTYNAATLTATITPTSVLAYGDTYTIVVVGGAFGVKDLAGNPLAQTVGSTFTTVSAPVIDTTPPTVTGVSPANGTVNISPTSVFTVTFSEAMNAATIDISKVLLLRNATNRVTASVAYNAATRTVTITPAAPLDNATNFSIYVVGGPAGVQDLSGNAMTADFISSFTTTAAPVTSTIFPSTTTPATVDSKDTKAIEVGVAFTADTSGFITGLRFYKSATNTGTHVAHLWTSTGQLIATATFTSETASGWQQVNFATPVAITAGTKYVASYFAPKGHYSDNTNYFTSPLNSGSLHVPVSGGVYMYGKTGGFPNQVYQNTNYWVDVVLNSTPAVDTQPPTVTNTTPSAGATNVAVGSSVTVFFSEAVNPTTVTNSTVRILDGSNLVTASLQYNSANNSATITPTSLLANSKTYTISVVGGFQGLKDVAGNPLAQNFTSTFTTAAAQQQDTTPPTVTGFSPANGAANVAIATPITVSFSEALNAATVTTSTVKLMNGSTAVAANVSYNASNNTVTITPTTALGNSTTYTISVVGGASGVKDGAGNALVQTVSSTFTTVAAQQQDTTPPTVTNFSPANGATNAAITMPIVVTFSEAMSAASVTSSTVKLMNGTTAVTANVSYNATNHTATITPTAALDNSKTYTISVVGGASGVKDVAGNALAQTVSSTFTTVAATAPTTLFPSTAKPGTVDVKESQAVEVGVTFTSDGNGFITGLRFYKAAGNTGTHVAHLWTSTGQLIATATFTSESASGWQQVNFAAPVAITAGTTYVASYYAPKGHFSVDRNYYSTQLSSGSLHVPVGGGVFSYGGSDTFPSQSYQNSNYWVDVVFAPS